MPGGRSLRQVMKLSVHSVSCRPSPPGLHGVDVVFLESEPVLDRNMRLCRMFVVRRGCGGACCVGGSWSPRCPQRFRGHAKVQCCEEEHHIGDVSGCQWSDDDGPVRDCTRGECVCESGGCNSRGAWGGGRYLEVKSGLVYVMFYFLRPRLMYNICLIYRKCSYQQVAIIYRVNQMY